MSSFPIPGVHAGHTTRGGTGVTVVLFPSGSVGSAELRGGAPATREIDVLHPLHTVARVDAVVFAGGSAFGLAATDGVMRYLAERGQGYPTATGPVPIVPAACIFDLPESLSAAEVVSALQTLVSRETAPSSPVVLTIGSVHGGTAGNIVAGEVVLEGTLRTFDRALRDRSLQRIDELAEGIARSMRGRAEFRLDSETIPVVNDPGVATLVSKAAAGVLGDGAVVQLDPLTVGEDFAYFLEARPGCFFLLGGAPTGPRVVHHTPDFRIDERCRPCRVRCEKRDGHTVDLEAVAWMLARPSHA